MGHFWVLSQAYSPSICSMPTKKTEHTAKVLTLQIEENPLTELIETIISKYLNTLTKPDHQKPSEILSQKDLAGRLDLSVPTVIGLRKKNIIQGVLVGNKWKFDFSEVWEALKAQKANQFTANKNGKA